VSALNGWAFLVGQGVVVSGVSAAVVVEHVGDGPVGGSKSAA